MKYVLFTIGIILILGGLSVFISFIFDITSSTPEGSTSAYLVGLSYFCIVPLAGGIALCIFTFKKWRKSKTEDQAKFEENGVYPKALFQVRRLKILLSICLLLLVPIMFLYAFDLPITAADYNRLGIEAHNQSNYDEAIANYNHAIDINPNYAIAYNNRGVAYRELSCFDNAMADYNQSIKLDPDYALVYWNRGYLQMLLGQNDEAMADFHQCLTLNPDASTLEKVEAALQQLEIDAIVFGQ